MHAWSAGDSFKRDSNLQKETATSRQSTQQRTGIPLSTINEPSNWACRGTVKAQRIDIADAARGGAGAMIQRDGDARDRIAHPLGERPDPFRMRAGRVSEFLT